MRYSAYDAFLKTALKRKNVKIKKNTLVLKIIFNDQKAVGLVYEKNNKIYTDKKVKITTGKEVIYGEGFTSNPNFTEYSITKIHGTFDFKSETN